MKKTALITGGNGTIGSVIAKKLSSDYNIIITYNKSKSKAYNVLNNINSNKNKIIKVDLSSLKSIKKMFAIISKEYEKLDFEKSFGGFTQFGFYFLKNFYGFINFRWATKYNSPLAKKSNNNNGFQLGLAYKIWSSKLKR